MKSQENTFTKSKEFGENEIKQTKEKSTFEDFDTIEKNIDNKISSIKNEQKKTSLEIDAIHEKMGIPPSKDTYPSLQNSEDRLKTLEKQKENLNYFFTAQKKATEIIKKLDSSIEVKVVQVKVHPDNNGEPYSTLSLSFESPDKKKNWTTEISPDQNYIDNKLEDVIKKIYKKQTTETKNEPTGTGIIENNGQQNFNNEKTKEERQGETLKTSETLSTSKNIENQNTKNFNQEFSEETRKELSDFFMQSLRNEKIFVEKNIENIRGMVRDSSIDAFKNLAVFSRAIHELSRDSRVPEKDRMFLKVQEINLSPIGAIEILPGTSSYALAVKSTTETLDKLLTKEVSLALHAYVEKIFLPPAKDYAKHGPEPFNGILFKPGE